MICNAPPLRHAITVTFLLLSSAFAQTSLSSSADYKKHMDEVQEATDDLTEAIDTKNSKQGIDTSKKLTELLHNDIDYWKVRKIDHAIELANSSYDLVVQIGRQAQGNDFATAHNTLLQLQTKCRACHDAQTKK